MKADNNNQQVSKRRQRSPVMLAAPPRYQPSIYFISVNVIFYPNWPLKQSTKTDEQASYLTLIPISWTPENVHFRREMRFEICLPWPRFCRAFQRSVSNFVPLMTELDIHERVTFEPPAIAADRCVWYGEQQQPFQIWEWRQQNSSTILLQILGLLKRLKTIITGVCQIVLSMASV